MTVIGLTGGTGAGKGLVCKKFDLLGIPSIDTDRTSRNVCLPEKPCLNELVDHFGSSILNADGSLNRPRLAELAFSSDEQHRALNSITHKHILAEVRSWLDEQRLSGKAAAIVDAPLLFESGFDKECDVIISVTAPVELRKKRIIQRDSITESQAQARIDKQHPNSFYESRSHYIIVNSESEKKLDCQIQNIYSAIVGRDGL